jgi:hypothetical protein
MDFQQIKEQLTEKTPQSFLTAVLRNEQDEDSLFVFSEQIEAQFEQNLAFLASAETISPADVDVWKQQDFRVVAQTIDGDYIAGTLDQTFIIPTSLYKSDIEIHSLFLSDFFVDYANHSLESALLPKNN